MEREKLAADLRRLLNSKCNDVVKLAYLTGEDLDQIDKLDLRTLTEFKRNEKGTVEITLIDRVKVAQLLDTLCQQEDGEGLDAFLDSLREDDDR